MSQALSVATAIEANRLASDVAFLALLDIEVINPDTLATVTMRRVVNNADPVTFQGELYEAGRFDVQVKQEGGKQAEVTLSITDHTQGIQAYMEAYGGGIGFNVTLYIVSAAELDKPAEMVVYCQIIGASSAGFTHSFQLGAENVLGMTFPRRRQTRDFCQKRFKVVGPGECNYAGGATSCDLTLKGANGCAAKSNTINFGAYPGLNNNGYRYV
jgi:phage-related protein